MSTYCRMVYRSSFGSLAIAKMLLCASSGEAFDAQSSIHYDVMSAKTERFLVNLYGLQ
jgi:hypothetical protein